MKEDATRHPALPPEKPVGAREQDFDIVLVDGVLGFSFSAGNAALVVAVSLLRISAMPACGWLALYAALVAAVFLLVGLKFTDAFQRKVGRKLILISHMVSFLGAAACMFFDVPYLAVTLASLGLASSAFLYGRFLANLARKALIFVVNAIFVYAGAMTLLVSQFNTMLGTGLLAAGCLLSTLVSCSFVRRKYVYADFVSAEDSRQRNIKLKGNNHTILLIGLMFSGGLAVFSLDIPFQIVIVVVGASMCLAGLLSTLTVHIDERSYKEWMKKSMTFVAVIFLAPLPFVPDVVRLALVSVYTCLVSLNVIILLSAVVESTRFDMISPIWLLGKDGSIFFLGLGLGSVVFIVGSALSQNFEAVPALACESVVIVAVCAWMQISVNYQVYPFAEEEEGEEETEQPVPEVEEGGQRKLAWQRRIDAACERYRLSPRECEVLRILLKGRDAKYITEKFYISQSTAKTHIYNIYRKFGIHSRQDLYDFIEEIELPDEEDSSSPEAEEVLA